MNQVPLAESRYQPNNFNQPDYGYYDSQDRALDRTQAESPGKQTNKSYSPLTKSRLNLRKDPTYMRPKKQIPTFNAKLPSTALMTSADKQRLKDQEQQTEIERRVYLLKKMSDNEKVRLILRRSQDKGELTAIRDMIKFQARDMDYINQRAIRYL